MYSLVDGGQVGLRCRDVLAADERWIAPEHWMVEVLSVLRGLLLGRKVSPAQAEEPVAELAWIRPIVPDTGLLLRRMWDLRQNLTTYDAAYVAAAELYGCALATTDARLAGAGPFGLSRDPGRRRTVTLGARR